jgi:hypothetical protein
MTTAIDYTVNSTDLSIIKSVQAHPLMPLSANTLTEERIIEFLDEDMRSTIVPLVLASKEEFYVENYDQTPVINVYNYTIPRRAAFATWRDIVWVDPMGNEIAMTELAPEYVKITYPVGNLPPIYTFGFILQNDHIILWPPNSTVPTQYQLRMKIKRAPNHLTPVDNCAQVSSVNPGSSQVTLDGNGDGTWSTSLQFDVIPNYPQFTSLGDDLSISAINQGTPSATVLTFDDYPTGIAVGDWVCPATLSPIPQIPYDMFPLLIQRGVIRCLESLGDTQNLQIAERRYQDMAVDFARTVSPRIAGTRKALVNRTANFGWNYNRAISR